ncbi:MAG TPA: ABC transporter ATP-binding protein [Acidimicrobiales bacterium]|jgi:iron(III) transport system ATP-binding protein|nr:ABC transporter ATP-binding protein [Acidimicrobiales bacterium]
MSELEVKGLRKAYDTQSVLEDLDLTVEAGSFVSILGPSGSGKTTLLRVIAGFDRADQGTVRLHGQIVDDESHFVESAQRRIGYVPQDGSLFPHLSVQANVGFGLARKDRHGKRVLQLLEMVGLEGFAQRYPHELSGGQQQRVALARGLAIEPSLVLLDEPFSSLDASLRAAVRRDVRRVLKESGTTAILVTHDQDEALSLADQVAIIRDGRIRQCAAPSHLYAKPATPELAREFGNSNFINGVANAGAVETSIGVLELEDSSFLEGSVRDGAKLLVLVRPEQIVLSHNLHDGRATARVLETEFYGHDAVVKLRATSSESLLLSARTPNPIQLPHVDDEVCVEVLGPVIAWPRDDDNK